MWYSDQTCTRVIYDKVELMNFMTSPPNVMIFHLLHASKIKPRDEKDRLLFDATFNLLSKYLSKMSADF